MPPSNQTFDFFEEAPAGAARQRPAEAPTAPRAAEGAPAIDPLAAAAAQAAQGIPSVSALTRAIQGHLEPAFEQVWVRGEVSNLRLQRSGHRYFSLKDSESQLPAVLFREQATGLAMPLEEGQALALFGRLNVYAPRGAYQLVVEAVVFLGTGALFVALEALKQRLAEEGLTAAARKRPLPRLLLRVGVITSASGAALQDFLQVLRRNRWPGTVVLLPSNVQGAQAASELKDRLHEAGACGRFDWVVLMRGGGSYEDLWAFNDEALARAVAATALGTVSAIGHETDLVLTDLVADVRAETPTAAAERIAGGYQALRQRVAALRTTWDALPQRQLERRAQLLQLRREQWRRLDAQRLLAGGRQRLDEASDALAAAMSRRLANARERLERQRQRLQRLPIPVILRAHRQQLAQLAERLGQQRPDHRLHRHRERLEQLALRLQAASPQSILRRGFALVQTPGGALRTAAAQVVPGETLRIAWHDGAVEAAITTASGQLVTKTEPSAEQKGPPEAHKG